MNIPNIITLIRLFLIPVFGYFMINESFVIAALIFIIAGFTDVLDGYIARKYNMITSWGKLADPLADKLMTITALTALTFQGRIPIFVIIIIVIKEILMGIGSIVVYKTRSQVVSANWYGKMATVIFYFAIIMLILRAPFGMVFIILAVGSALFAFIRYLMEYIAMASKRQKQS